LERIAHEKIARPGGGVDVVFRDLNAGGRPDRPRGGQGVDETGGKDRDGAQFQGVLLSLADAKVETTLFLESREAKQRPELADQVRKILDHYDTARQIWKLKVTKIEDFGTAFGHLISLQKGSEGDLGRLLLKKYPQANKPADKGGALTMGAYGSRGANEILVDHMISIIWKEASQELKEAIRMVVK